jgi:ABC-type nitrate/sulfonate/bicarbonate transport system substrate-binding protein
MSRTSFAAAAATGTRRRMECACAILLAMAASTLPQPAAGEKLVLQLHRDPQFEFAGYYAALWQGFYRDAGLDVEIRSGAPPGGPAIDPVREVADGHAQFGTGTMRLVIRAAQGLPLTLLAPVFQRSGAALYYRADASYPSPGALLKAKIGRPPPSDILTDELTTALRVEGIDPAKLQYVLLKPGEAVAALAEKRVDAAIGSAWDVPWQAHERGLALKFFDPADYRVEFYGDTLFTLQRIADADPAAVRSFRAASLKGWDYALQHENEIVGRLLAEQPIAAAASDPIGFANYQAEVARRLARYPGTPLGHSNRERWNRIQESLAAAGAMQRTVDVGDFVYDPEGGGRTGGAGRAGAVPIAALFAAAAVALGLLSWRRWRQAPIGPASPGEDLAAAPPVRIPAAVEHVFAPSAAALAALAKHAAGWLARIPGIASRLPVLIERYRGKPDGADVNAALADLDRVLRRRLTRPTPLRLSLFAELWPCAAAPRAIARAVLDLTAATAAELPARADLLIGTRNISLDPVRAGELAAATGDYVRVTVRDSGPGIAEAAFGHLFDPATTSKPAIAAAGQAVERLGGFVRVETAEGVGTAVHFFFPRAADSGARAQRRVPPAAAAD